MGLYRLKGPQIPRDLLGMYVEAALYDVLHKPDMTGQERLAALRALASLAKDLSGYWTRKKVNPRLWFRSSGLTATGGLTSEVLSRLAEVQLSPDSTDGGGSDA